MDISSQAEFPATPDRVFAMLTDQSYLEQVAVASHARSHECTVDGSTTRSKRELPAPEQAQRFTGPTLTIVEEIVWGEAAEDGSRTGQVSLTAPGQPLVMNGTATLAPADGGSVVSIKADLKINIPLLGRKLEASAAPMVIEGLKIQESVGREWLA